MTASIVLDNSNVLSELVPTSTVTAHSAGINARTANDAQATMVTMHSPTSSASVNEWGPNSDSDLFGSSSPPSPSAPPAHAVTSVVFSSPFSAMSRSADTPAAVWPCDRQAVLARQAELDRQFEIDFRQWFEDVDWTGVVSQAPTSSAGASTGASDSAAIVSSARHVASTSTISTDSNTSATAGDATPAPPTYEHAAELNALIERMRLQIANLNLNTSVSQTVTAEMPLDTRQPRPSHYVAPVAPASAREVVVSEDDEDEDEDEDVPDLLDTPTFRPGAKDSSLSNVVPSASAITGSTPAAILFFDAPSASPQQSVEAPLISIAQYFNRKAGERGAALADVDVDVRGGGEYEVTGAESEGEAEETEGQEQTEDDERQRRALTPHSPASFIMTPPSPSSSSASSCVYVLSVRPDSETPFQASPGGPRSSIVRRGSAWRRLFDPYPTMSLPSPSPSPSPPPSSSPSPSPPPSPPMSKGTSIASDLFSSAAEPVVSGAPVFGAAEVTNATARAPQRYASYAYLPVFPTCTLSRPPVLESRNALRPSLPSPSLSLSLSPSPSETLPPQAPRLLSGSDPHYGNRNYDELDSSSFQAWFNKQSPSHAGLTPRSALVPPSPRAFAQAAAPVGIPPPPPLGAVGGATARPRPRPPLPTVPMSAPAPPSVPASVLRMKAELTPAPRELPLPSDVHPPFVSYAQALPANWTCPAVRAASTSLLASSDASSSPPGNAREVNTYTNTNANAKSNAPNTSAPNTRARRFSWSDLGIPPSPFASRPRPAPAPAPSAREARWEGVWGDSVTTSDSDDIPPIPPPRGLPSPKFAPWGTGTPALPAHPGMDPPYGSWPHCARARSPFEGERELKFVYAPPARSWSWDRYVPPPPPPPFLAPPAPPPFYAPSVPPPAMGPGMGMGMGMGAGMWTPPEGCYIHFPSEPVIAPTGPPSAVCYTTVAKYAFADATVVFRVETFLYKVHRHFFERHSEHFVLLLKTYVFGYTNHVFLPGVKKADFECLLSVFYPENLTTPDITSLAGWTAVLTLAQRYAMAQPRALALAHIGALASPMEMITIAHTHALSPRRPVWLLPAYKAVCASGAPPARHEVEGLDAGTVWGIWEVQHALAQGARGREVYEEREKWVERLVRERFGPFEHAAEAEVGNAFVY